jgi:stage III sporulation protein AG
MKNFKFLNNIKENVKKLLNTNKKIFFLTIALIVVMILIFVSTFFKSKNSSSSSATLNQSVSVSDYASDIENKLSQMLILLDSVSSVSVFVMVDSTPEVKYLTESEEQTSSNSSGTSTTTKTTTVVFEKNGSISTPVAITTIMPKVSGVLIVLNKISASTKLSITNAVSTVLNVDSSCICILQES